MYNLQHVFKHYYYYFLILRIDYIFRSAKYQSQLSNKHMCMAMHGICMYVREIVDVHSIRTYIIPWTYKVHDYTIECALTMLLQDFRFAPVCVRRPFILTVV